MDSEKNHVYSGVVVRGAAQAARLGFPTANIVLTDGSLSGTYAARVSIEGKGERYNAAVYADQKRLLLEAHLLDFSGELHGARVSMELLKKIRDDETFADEPALKAAIASDVARVRDYFSA